MSESLVTAKRMDGKTRIAFGASLDVASAAEVKAGLGKILRRKPPYELDGSSIERIDTAGLQVLAAFISETASRDQEVRWTAASEALKSASTLLGLNKKLELDD